jgi:hypothetical protein
MPDVYTRSPFKDAVTKKIGDGGSGASGSKMPEAKK